MCGGVSLTRKRDELLSAVVSGLRHWMSQKEQKYLRGQGESSLTSELLFGLTGISSMSSKKRLNSFYL